MNGSDSLLEFLDKMFGEVYAGSYGKHPNNREMVLMALARLGGHAHVDSICEQYQTLRATKRPDMPWKSEAQVADIVKATLRKYSQEHAEMRPCFINCEPGLGYWKAVEGIWYDEERKVIKRGRTGVSR